VNPPQRPASSPLAPRQNHRSTRDDLADRGTVPSGQAYSLCRSASRIISARNAPPRLGHISAARDGRRVFECVPPCRTASRRLSPAPPPVVAGPESRTRPRVHRGESWQRNRRLALAKARPPACVIPFPPRESAAPIQPQCRDLMAVAAEARRQLFDICLTGRAGKLGARDRSAPRPYMQTVRVCGPTQDITRRATCFKVRDAWRRFHRQPSRLSRPVPRSTARLQPAPQPLLRPWAEPTSASPTDSAAPTTSPSPLCPRPAQSETHDPPEESARPNAVVAGLKTWRRQRLSQPVHPPAGRG